jgi:DNA-binding transcriptional regulator YhcF (GntR family)
MFDFAIDKKKSLPVHQQLARGLKKYAMLLKHGAKMPSENILCREFSLARMTVSRALNDLVKDDILFRIKGKGTFVNKPQHKVESIKFLLPGPGCLTGENSDARIVKNYLAGMINEARRENIRVETVLCTADHMQNSLQPEQFSSLKKNDNVFVLSQWWHPIFPALAESGCNVVYENNQRMNPEFEEIFKNWYLLTNDIVGTASDLVSYFAGIGRKNILGFNIIDLFESPDPRTIGYRQGLERNNIAFNEKLMPMLSFEAYKEPENLIKLIVNTYKKCPFDAVVIPASLFSIFFQIALLEHLGLRCPEDVVMVSLEDSYLNTALQVPVSGMNLSCYDMGAEAVRAFNRKSFTAGEKSFRSMLIERESSRKGCGVGINLSPEFNENINNNDIFQL